MNHNVALPSGSANNIGSMTLTANTCTRVHHRFGVSVNGVRKVRRPLTHVTNGTCIVSTTTSLVACNVVLNRGPTILSTVIGCRYARHKRRSVVSTVSVANNGNVVLKRDGFLTHTCRNTPVTVAIRKTGVLAHDVVVFKRKTVHYRPCILRRVRTTGGGSIGTFSGLLFGRVNRINDGGIHDF